MPDSRGTCLAAAAAGEFLYRNAVTPSTKDGYRRAVFRFLPLVRSYTIGESSESRASTSPSTPTGEGGASEDRAQGVRSLLEMQRCGRWAVESSARRYEQAGRLQAVLARIPPAVVDHGIACETHLADLLCRPRLLKRPCLAPAAVLHQEALDDDFEFVGDVDE